MKLLITGAAGFIGYHTIDRLLKNNHEIIGIDNLNDYYSVDLKKSRLEQLGITIKDNSYNEKISSCAYPNYTFIKLDIEDRESLQTLFKTERFDSVIHLAAQPGVRYSIDNPYKYIQTNIVGFINILECCRHNSIVHCIYASSSGIYGKNSKIPFSEDDQTDTPVSLYAATKKADELMAYTYTELFNFSTTGLRFFTVYGPWGRPDMAPMLFAKSISKGETIKVFNNGNMSRDFTFIDDITEGISRVVDSTLTETSARIYNIGCGSPVQLMQFIQILEQNIGKKATIKYLPMQKGDVYKTYADTSKFEHDFGYKPQIKLKEGIEKFVEWYKDFYA